MPCCLLWQVLPVGISQVDCYFYVGAVNAATTALRLEFQLNAERRSYRFRHDDDDFDRRFQMGRRLHDSDSEDYSYNSNYWSSYVSPLLPRQMLNDDFVYHKSGASAS